MFFESMGKVGLRWLSSFTADYWWSLQSSFSFSFTTTEYHYTINKESPIPNSTILRVCITLSMHLLHPEAVYMDLHSFSRAAHNRSRLWSIHTKRGSQMPWRMQWFGYNGIVSLSMPCSSDLLTNEWYKAGLEKLGALPANSATAKDAVFEYPGTCKDTIWNPLNF